MSKLKAAVALQSSADYAAAVASSDDKLVVIDVHGWAGPCAALDPVFRRLAVETVRAAAPRPRAAARARMYAAARVRLLTRPPRPERRRSA